MFDLGLTDKCTLITGGSDGLGRATAVRFATEGARVVICGRRADYLQEQAQAIASETGGEVHALQADVSSAEDCARLIADTERLLGGIDCLINNAGASAAASLMDVDDAAWQADFELKVMAAKMPSRPHPGLDDERNASRLDIGGGQLLAKLQGRNRRRARAECDSTALLPTLEGLANRRPLAALSLG